MKALKEELRNLTRKSPETVEFCKRVLNSERYGGNAVLMVVDSAITSVGVNYFSVVVPRVLEFKERFVDSGMVLSFDDFLRFDQNSLYQVWKNKRSWNVAFGIAETILDYGDGVSGLRKWAGNADLENWRKWLDVKGAGINTFQYLRMMGGIDTVMPDRIVRRFLEKHAEMPADPVEFVKRAESIAEKAGFRAVELCWLSWLSSYNDEKIRRYSSILAKI